VALLGDAAHAMTPHQGMGGGSAIEDAYILGLLLAHPSTNLINVMQALKIYESIRLPFVQRVAEQSRTNGLLYEFLDPKSKYLSLEALGEEIDKSFAWLGLGGCKEEWERAEIMLKGL
jgi:salicylate hydroxylase